MSHRCEDCDRLLTQPSGTAPERPLHCKHPTLYDHLKTFQKFKQHKEHRAQLQATKAELSQFNSNFTNWHPGCGDEFSTQKLVGFQKFMKNNPNDAPLTAKDNINALDTELGGSKNVTTAHDTLPKISSEKQSALLAISHTPVACPISSCTRTIGVTSVFSHYLRDHDVPCVEIFRESTPLHVSFDLMKTRFYKSFCIGILAYGGDHLNIADRPAERGICARNGFLPKLYEHLESHLPILIMGCRTTLNSVFKGKSDKRNATFGKERTKPKQILAEANDIQELLVIWLVSAETTEPIYCTVTLYNEAMTTSMSSLMEVRQLNQAQEPENFLPNDVNCFCLGCGAIKKLTMGHTDLIQMEILINEYKAK